MPAGVGFPSIIPALVVPKTWGWKHRPSIRIAPRLPRRRAGACEITIQPRLLPGSSVPSRAGRGQIHFCGHSSPLPGNIKQGHRTKRRFPRPEPQGIRIPSDSMRRHNAGARHHDAVPCRIGRGRETGAPWSDEKIPKKMEFGRGVENFPPSSFS